MNSCSRQPTETARSWTWWSHGAIVWLATIAGVWTVLLCRASSFQAQAASLLRSMGSSDAAADYQQSCRILLCYGASSVIGVGLAWLMRRTRSQRLLLTNVVCGLLALYLLWSRPEEVIVFIPATSPFFVMVISLFAGVEALANLSGRWRCLFWVCFGLSAVAAAAVSRYVQAGLSLGFAAAPWIGWVEACLLLFFPIRWLATIWRRRNVL
jgi:hypothetical protein